MMSYKTYILIVSKLGTGDVSITLALSIEQIKSLFLVIRCLLICQNELLLCS